VRLYGGRFFLEECLRVRAPFLQQTSCVVVMVVHVPLLVTHHDFCFMLRGIDDAARYGDGSGERS
jgi:hypothetical protein